MARRGLPKTIGGWVGLGFKILGGVVIAGPAINVVMTDLSAGKPQSIPNDVLFAYTGLGGSTSINSTQLLTGVGSIAGGVVLIYLGKMLGRLIR